ncbi:MAG: hypothetical protein AABZ39_04195 [Spirochaetota bacterium]
MTVSLLPIGIAFIAAPIVGYFAFVIGEKYNHPARKLFALNARPFLMLSGAAFGVFLSIALFNTPMLLLSIPMVTVLLIVIYTDATKLHVHPILYALFPYAFLMRYLLSHSTTPMFTVSVFGLAFASVLYLGIYFGFKEKMGFGDAAIGMAAGATLGLELLAIISAAAAFSGIICILIRKYVMKREKPRLAFAALLSAAWCVVLVFVK